MTWNRQRTVQLTGALLAALAVVALILGLKGGGGADAPEAQPTESALATTADAHEGTISTIAYYADSNGYLVPVMRRIPEQDGVARATLSLMVKSDVNDREAARMGLSTLLPEDCSIDIDINSEGLARVDLGSEANAMASAESESNMIAGVVAALGEFPTVKQVEFLIGGQRLDALKHGTDISKPITPGPINIQSMAEVSEAFSAQQLTLYFPDESSRLMVPVTRMVYGEGDLTTAVVELAKGAGAGLSQVLPEDCGIIGVSVSDGIATINFTREFMDIAEQSDGGRASLKALALTCTQFEGIEGVDIQVEGESYDPGAGALAVPTFANVAEEIPTVGYQQVASVLSFE